MKNFTLSLLSLFIVVNLSAQSVGEVQLKLVDQSNNSAIVGAVVSLIDSQNSSTHKLTDESGSCKYSIVKFGDYQILATLIGYDTVRQSIKVNKSLVDLGTIKMKEGVMQIDKVTVMADAIRTSQSGDTVIYNADAFKVTSDAVAAGLLAKMPGITVDDSGEVEAQGESVERVYVDGKEFFGEDVSLAVNNIPADIIDKVEVFNKLSDDAEFTGFDDGDSYKAINIVTRTGMNRGHFGKFTAGYAYEDLYQLSANYNYFTNNHRLSFILSANNMNIKGFGSQDVVGGGGMVRGGGGSGGSSGLSTIGSFGVNYGGSFNEEKLKIEASYFYNMQESETETVTDREYITDVDEYKRYYDAESYGGSDNYNHRFNGRLEYKPNSRHSFMMRPEFSFQDNGTSSLIYSSNTESEDGISLSELNSTSAISNNDKVAYNISNTIVYRVLIGQQGRNIMATARGSYMDNNSDALSETSISYDGDLYSFIKQNTLNGTKSYNLSSSITYSEPIFHKSAMVTMKYDVSHKYSDADYLVYEWEQEQNIFNPDYDPTGSNIYNSGYTTHNIGPGFMYSKKNSLSINANASYQSSLLANDQEVPVITPNELKYSFNNFVYSFMLRQNFNQTNSLRVMLRSNTSNPSVSQLQDVVVDSDPLNVTSGNSDLKPSYNNSLRATYNRSNIYKGRTFMAMLSGSLTNNYIGQSTVLLLDADDSYTLPNEEQLESYGKYVKPVNLDGNWSVTSSMTYGMPVSFLYSNLNFNLGASYSELPSIFNGVDNLTMNQKYQAGASLGSNISEYVDFTLSYTGGYNIADYKYTLAGMSSQRNEYITQKASAQFKFVFWAGITLTGTGTYTQYRGITDTFNEEYLLCNVYIGKKVFKNQRGEISIGVNDLLDQSESFVRNINDNYIENVYSNTLGRYYGIKFTFDLRRFNGSNTNMSGRGQRSDYGGGRGEGMGGDMGGMGGGMGGMGGGGMR